MPVQQLLIQMSGLPGTGKSTLSRAVAKNLSAVVLDHDISKTALVQSGLEDQLAGRFSYEALKGFAQSILEQGHSVIIDSPCLYQELLDFGSNVSARYGAKYQFIECIVEDLDLLGKRLEARDSKPTQLKNLHGTYHHHGKDWSSRELIEHWGKELKRPDIGGITIDMSSDFHACLKQALEYLNADA